MPKALSSPAQQIVVPGIVQLPTHYKEINLSTKWCVHANALYNVGCCMAQKEMSKFYDFRRTLFPGMVCTFGSSGQLAMYSANIQYFYHSILEFVRLPIKIGSYSA